MAKKDRKASDAPLGTGMARRTASILQSHNQDMKAQLDKIMGKKKEKKDD